MTYTSIRVGPKFLFGRTHVASNLTSRAPSVRHRSQLFCRHRRSTRPGKRYIRMPISSASAAGSGIAVATGGGIAVATGGDAPELSASSIVARTAAGSHTLTIDGFSRAKSMRFSSDSASVTEEFGAPGMAADGEGGGKILMLLKLRCTHCAAGEEVSESCSFSFLDQNDQPSNSKSAGGVYTFSQKTGHGVALLDTKFLESRTTATTYLGGDRLRVRCDVTVYMALRCEDRDVPSRLVAVPPPEFGEQLGRLLSSGVGADLTFEVDGETFSVHKHILNVRATVLLEEISSGATTCKQIIGVVEARVFKALLHYIYTDSLPEIDETMDLARHLIAAADRYSLGRLKLICEDMLCPRVDKSTVAATLAIAEEYNCHGLKKACFQFLMSGSNLKGAMEDGGFEHLRNSCPSVLKELLSMVDRR